MNAKFEIIMLVDDIVTTSGPSCPLDDPTEEE